jgi:hypothetical protein
MITFILLSHQDIGLLQTRINEFVRGNSQLVRLLVVESSARDYILQHISKIRDSRIEFIFDQVSGIYPSMNHAISCVRTKYYIVIGLDDQFNYSIVENICDYLNSKECDILFLGVKKGVIDMAFFNPEKLNSGPQGIFPSHTGGAVIRTELHNKYGKYDGKYKIVADGLFILRCLKGGILGALYPVICCKVGDQGFSKKNELLAEWESYKVRRVTGVGFCYSCGLFLIRLFRRIIKNLVS